MAGCPERVGIWGEPPPWGRLGLAVCSLALLLQLARVGRPALVVFLLPLLCCLAGRGLWAKGDWTFPLPCKQAVGSEGAAREKARRRGRGAVRQVPRLLLQSTWRAPGGGGGRTSVRPQQQPAQRLPLPSEPYRPGPASRSRAATCLWWGRGAFGCLPPPRTPRRPALAGSSRGGRRGGGSGSAAACLPSRWRRWGGPGGWRGRLQAFSTTAKRRRCYDLGQTKRRQEGKEEPIRICSRRSAARSKKRPHAEEMARARRRHQTGRATRRLSAGPLPGISRPLTPGPCRGDGASFSLRGYKTFLSPSSPSNRREESLPRKEGRRPGSGIVLGLWKGLKSFRAQG